MENYYKEVFHRVKSKLTGVCLALDMIRLKYPQDDESLQERWDTVERLLLESHELLKERRARPREPQ